MKLTVTNRFAADPAGWIHLSPLGDFAKVIKDRDQEREIVQRVDAQALRQMINTWISQGRRPLLLDIDHESHDQTKRTTAAGWIEELQARDDGLWGRVRWSAEGETSVANGAYRFVSPVWDAYPVSTDSHIFRPERLRDAGLTNQPALHGLKPISNRSEDDPGTNLPTHQQNMKSIALALKLPDTATEAEILAAITALQTRASELETAEKAASAELTNRALDDAGLAADDPARKSWAALLLANRTEGLKALAGLKAAREANPVAAAAAGKKTLANREPQTPAVDAAVAEAKDAVRAAKIQNRASEIATREKVSWSVAWQRAEAEAGNT